MVRYKTLHKLKFCKISAPTLFLCAHVLVTFNFCLAQTTESGVESSELKS